MVNFLYQLVLKVTQTEKKPSVAILEKFKPSKQESESLQSLGGALVKFAIDRGYKSSNLPDGKYVVYDKNNANGLVIVPPNDTIGQNLRVYVLGSLKTNQARVQVSFTPDGILRIARNGKNIFEIKGASLNFDGGIELKNVRVKLSEGTLLPLVPLFK